MRNNTKGVYAERWRHSHGCGRFFNALRDTTTDHFLATYEVGAPQPAAPKPVAPPSAAPRSPDGSAP
jgi:sarcosine oxidase subunit delta